MSTLSKMKNVRVVNHIINMTDEPIRMYDNSTGEIEVFYPNARRFCQSRSKCVFPQEACYVFTPDMIGEIESFSRDFRNVAVVISKDRGRDDVMVSTLATADRKELFLFRRKTCACF